MKQLNALVAMVLLALWLPAQSHCLLERVGWLWTSDCCVDEKAAPAAPGGSPCSEKTCCNLDTPTYKVDQKRPLSRAPLLAGYLKAALPEQAQTPHTLLGFLPVASPPFSVSWHFSLRVAAPPRAPCLAA